MSRNMHNMLARGEVALGDSSPKLQTLQVKMLADEGKAGVEHFEPYGWTSAPLAGAEVFVSFLDGDRSHGIVTVATDRRYRIQDLQPGEVAIFTHEGDSIIFRNGHEIDLATHTLNIVATTINSRGAWQHTGKLTASDDVLARTVSLYNHEHSGVQPGSGYSGPPIGGGSDGGGLGIMSGDGGAAAAYLGGIA